MLFNSFKLFFVHQKNLFFPNKHNNSVQGTGYPISGDFTTTATFEVPQN